MVCTRMARPDTASPLLRYLLAVALAGLPSILAAAGAWSTEPSLPVAVQEVSVAAVDGRVYVFGGSVNQARVNTVYAFDPSPATWATRAPYPGTARDHMGVAVVNGLVYLVGGVTAWPTPSVSTVNRYDPVANSWTTVAPLPAARGAMAVGAVNGLVYAAGGLVNGSAAATLTAYNPTTNSWQTLASMPTPRDHATGIALNGKLYVIGGRTTDTCAPLKTVEVYDPGTDSWTAGPSLTTARGGHAAGVANGRIQVFGGEGAASTCGTIASAEEFDPTTGRWSALPPMPTPRHGTGGATIGTSVYIPGGGSSTGDAATAVHERFDVSATTALPAPWTSTDIGAVGQAGSASVSNGVFTVRGGGSDIWGNADSFQFVQQVLGGDTQITARVLSLQNTHVYAKAGLMLRASLDTGAAHVVLDYTPGGSLELMTRGTNGGSTTYLGGMATSLPVWVRLTRTGTTVVGSASTNGTTWTEVARTTIALPSTIYVGLPVTSHTTTSLTTATFDNVAVSGQPGNLSPAVTLTTPAPDGVYSAPGPLTLTASASDVDGTIAGVEFFAGSTSIGTASGAPYTLNWSSIAPAPYSLTAVATDNSGNRTTSTPVAVTVVTPATSGLPSPFARRDVGAVGKAGSATFSGGTFTLQGAGADIWGPIDGFQYVYRGLTGDGRIVARVQSLQNTHVYAKAGVMFRESLSASSRHALLDVRPTGDLEYLTRLTTGGNTEVYGSGRAPFPAWLRITRTGNTFTAESSPDGAAWTFIGTVVVQMPPTLYVGILVSSHDTTTLATATFTDVSVTTSAPPPPPTVTFTTRALAASGSTSGTTYGVDGLFGPSSLQLGPDGRLYVASVMGRLYALTLDPTKVPDASQLAVVASQRFDDIYLKPTRTCNINNEPMNCAYQGRVGRQVTGLLIGPTSTANDISLFVSSSSPSASTTDLGVDTYSGTITRLRLTPNLSTPDPNDLAVVENTDLVVGLPRSREAHSVNGLSIGPDGWLYVAVGGNTNAGQRSTYFGDLPEYYLAASVVRLNLAALGGRTLPIDTSAITSAATLSPLAGVFEQYSTGYRNAYDLTWHSNGRLYLNDNAANFSQGNTPGSADGCPTPSISPGNQPDTLHVVTAGAFGGHPNPTHGQCVFSDGSLYSPPLTPAPGYAPRMLEYDNGSSTNGIVEYTASAFGGAMKGNLVSATFAGNQNVRRVVLDGAGTAVVSEENLGQFAQPLDVATDAAGNIYVAEYGASRITVMIPGQLATCPVPNSDPTVTDSDTDGYTDADEQSSGTGLCNPASRPTDFDGDRIGDLNDPDDDNDGIADAQDQLYFDAQNGASTVLPLAFEYDPASPAGGRVANSGFTGVQIPSVGVRFDASLIKAGDAGGHITLTTTSGTAEGSANSQVNALQVGFDSSSSFRVWTQLVQPFTTTAAASGHVAGVFFGPDKDNFVRIALVGVNGGGRFIQAGIEQAGVFTAKASIDVTTATVSYLDLHLVGDATAHTLSAYYDLNRSGVLVLVVKDVPAPSGWFVNNAGAARNTSITGLMTSHGSATPTAFGFDFFRIDRSIPAPPPPPAPPAAPTGPVPTSGATGVLTTTALSWSASAGATSYDVAFGTSSPPPTVSSGQVNTTYQPPATLSYGTTYFWQVVAKNGGGATAGPVWTFTTAASPPPPPPPSTTVRRLRVLTWHVNGGRDRSGTPNIDAQVSLLARSGAEVIVLQGVTVDAAGDQFALFPQKLSAATGRTWNTVAVEDPRPSSSPVEGNLLLTTLPLASSATTTFDTAPWDPAALDAKRSAVRATIIVNNVAVSLATTQLALDAARRQTQLDALQAWIAAEPAPHLIGGSFNMPPTDSTYTDMAGVFTDTWAALVNTGDQGTTAQSFGPSGQPARVDDWWQEISDTRARATEVWVIKTARSSHHAVVAEVKVQ